MFDSILNWFAAECFVASHVSIHHTDNRLELRTLTDATYARRHLTRARCDLVRHCVTNYPNLLWNFTLQDDEIEWTNGDTIECSLFCTMPSEHV